MPQGSLLVAVPPVVVNVHYVVVVFKLFDKQSHKLAVVLTFKVHGRIGYLFLIGGLDLISRRLESIGNIVNVLRLGVDDINSVISLEIGGSRFKRGLHQLVLVDLAVFVGNDDNALFAEHEADASALTEITVIF